MPFNAKKDSKYLPTLPLSSFVQNSSQRRRLFLLLFLCKAASLIQLIVTFFVAYSLIHAKKSFLRFLYFKGIHLHSAAQIENLFETITFLHVIQPLLQCEPATKDHTLFFLNIKVSGLKSDDAKVS